MNKIEIQALTPREIIKGFRGRFIHTANTTLAYWDIDEGAALPLHAHVHEQTTQVLEGRFELTINGHSMICEPGSVVIIPSNIPHSGVALTPCKIMDIFSSIREDYQA